MNARVHFFGDSYVAGFGDPEGLGWVGRLAPLCTELEFVNHGVPGEDSLQAIARFFEADFQEHDRACVFSFGTNDVVAGVPQEQSLGALEAALVRCDELGISAVLVLPPAVAGLPSADEPLAELCDGFAQLAGELAADVVSARELLSADGAWYAEARAGDGAHPQAAGYAELAEVLAAAGLPQLLIAAAQR